MYIYILILGLLIPNTLGCILNKGESRLGQGDCYCENSFHEFGILSEASEFKPTRLAFFGDSTTTDHAKSVLQMIKNNDVDAIIHLGDLDYDYNPPAMEEHINSVFSEEYPYIYIIGNHETEVWNQYQQNNYNRLLNQSGDIKIYCKGNHGVQSYCLVNGIEIILSGIDILCDNHESYISNKLQESNAKWKICGWHKNHSSFQLSDKTDEVGLSMYQNCINHGALIMTAHSHIYARTYPITNAEYKTITNDYTVFPGQSMIFSIGTGGAGLSSEKNNNRSNFWWNAAFTRDHLLEVGALICDFTIGSVTCHYKTFNDHILDSVTLHNTESTECITNCPECTKSWLPPIPDGCGGICPIDNCLSNERCSSSAGYKCVYDPDCELNCPNDCINEDESQPGNWCGGTCNLPSCLDDQTCISECPECSKSWLPPVPDGCGGYCAVDTCKSDERCSSSAGFTCVYDPDCLQYCPDDCLEPGENQPGNWCGGTCELPNC